MKIINFFCLLFYFSCLSFFLYYSLLYSGYSNHSGFNPIFCIGIFCFAGTWFSIFLKKLSKDRMNKIINNLQFVILILFFSTAILFNIFNVMVSYTTWTHRGMPEKYEFKIKK